MVGKTDSAIIWIVDGELDTVTKGYPDGEFNGVPVGGKVGVANRL